jgi:hypothetical protein
MVTEDQLKEFEAKYKRIARVQSADKNDNGSPKWEVVLRRPSRMEYNRYRTSGHDSDRKADAQDELIRQIAILPSGEGIAALIEDWPGIPEACGEAIAKLAGMEAGKL